MENTWKERKAPRMRTIKEAMREIRQEDPYTAFTESLLRKMIRSGKLPVIRESGKILLNLDILYSVLNAEPEPAAPSGDGWIKPIG